MKPQKATLFSLLFIFSLFVSGQNNNGYLSGKLIYKIHPNQEKSVQHNLFQQLFTDNNWNTKRKFPKHSPSKNKSTGKNHVDLSSIYELSFNQDIDPLILSRKLMSTGKFEYVEPVYEQKLAYTPNDTSNHLQYYLDLIEAYQAWSINRGDTNVVIGIVDTGVDIDHPDLVDNLFYNYADPINGIDDDNDGYVDNYLGWDLGNNDNDVSVESYDHGVNVAGIASASTDNITGISGVGFSCKILPVKIDNTAGRLVGAYDGIVYAADHGADIINNSWGSYQYSEFSQDVINYAASKGVLIVSAVGNDSTERVFYPAGYENVLSVGSSEQQDFKKHTSNYGHWVDVFAPGEAMYTLNSIGGYGINGGTSMASPVVAGVAGLIKSQFPNYSPKQIEHKILTTADNIDHLNIPEYNGKLGTGRVNAFRALTENFHPGIEMHSIQLTDKKDDLFHPGDTIFISGEFTNYLSPANNVVVSVSGNNSYFGFLKSSISLGLLDSLQTKSNFQDPFLLKVKGGVPTHHETELKITIQSGNYQSTKYLKLIIDPDYIHVEHNQISTTLTSTGRIGYNDDGLNEGLGFRFKNGNSHLFEASFMIGNGPNSVADHFRSDGSTPDQDFKRISPIQKEIAKKADFEYQTVFTDANLPQPMGLEITQRNFIFDSTSLDNQLFFIYHVKNTSSQTISNLYAGIIADWDILDYSNNKVGYDAERKMGISYSTDSNLYFGIKLLSDQNVNHYAIDNFGGGMGGVNLSSGFSDAEKFTVLSNSRDSAGTSSITGNDILDAVSAGPVNLLPDSSISFDFVLLAAESLSGLITSAEKAQQSYDNLALKVDEFKLDDNLGIIISPNPSNNEIKVKFSLASKQSCILNVYDSAGQLVYEKDFGKLGRNNYEKQIPLKNFRSGVYFLNLFVGNKKIQDKFVVIK